MGVSHSYILYTLCTTCHGHNINCYPLAMATAARVYIDEGEGEAYERSSCTNSTKWAGHEVSCYAQVVEDVLCVRVNTLNAYYEANHLVSHHLSEFDLHSYAAAVRSKVGGCVHIIHIYYTYIIIIYIIHILLLYILYIYYMCAHIHTYIHS